MIVTVLTNNRGIRLFQTELPALPVLLGRTAIGTVFPGTTKLDWFFPKNAIPYISQ